MITARLHDLTLRLSVRLCMIETNGWPKFSSVFLNPNTDCLADLQAINGWRTDPLYLLGLRVQFDADVPLGRFELR